MAEDAQNPQPAPPAGTDKRGYNQHSKDPTPHPTGEALEELPGSRYLAPVTLDNASLV